MVSDSLVSRFSISKLTRQEIFEKYEKKENFNNPPMIEGMICKCCPVFNTFDIIGKKFSLLILRNMIYNNHKRFNEFLFSIEEINPKTLSVRLKEMEKNGIISRQVYNETPVRIEYKLTQKGKELQPVLEQMALFSIKYCCDQVFENPDPIKINKIISNTMTRIQ